MKLCSTLAVIALAFSAIPYANAQSSLQDKKAIYLDANQTVEARADALLSVMTLEEKVAQMTAVWEARQRLENDQGEFVAKEAPEILGNGIGHVARPSENKSPGSPNKTPLATVRFTNDIQRWLIENTRLGIPAIFHEEALHGHAAQGATSFPQAIALASTFSPELIEKTYSIAAAEVRKRGGNHALTPILDVARDPRWGRFEETWGEDPYLVATLGMAAVKGFQGPKGDKIPSDKVAATLKHLTGHGEPSGGLNIAPTPVGERTLRDVFLFPFEAAVREAGVRSIMPSYNEIDGIPSHANKGILTDVLRNEWGFEGTVVSDYFAIDELIGRHHLTDNKATAAQLALNAGVDIEMPNPDTYTTLAASVKNGNIDIALVDRAVKRILQEKFRLGLFENPYTPTDGVEAFIGNAEHVAFSQHVAEQAVILLQNKTQLLPLDKNAIKSIAVIGPHVHETLLGGYSDVPSETVSVLEGIQHYVGDKVKVNYAQGTLITRDDWPVDPDSKAGNSRSRQRWHTDVVELATDKDTKGLFKAAVRAAKKSDVAVVVIGENEGVSREAWGDNHLGDRTRLDLVGNQQALAEAIIATGTPTIIVLQNGRPLAIEALANKADTLIEAWYLGQNTGHALANILFGEVSPGGKLPATVPRTVGQLPVYYNYKPSAKRGYAFDQTTPLFPFGYGLSYSTFTFSDLSIDASHAKANGEVLASITVKNTGKRAASEVAQVYIRDLTASITRPVKELKAYKRVTLEPGQSAKIQFTIPVNLLGFHDHDLNYVVEPGPMKLMVGSSSADIHAEGEFAIKGKRADVSRNKAFSSYSKVTYL